MLPRGLALGWQSEGVLVGKFVLAVAILALYIYAMLDLMRAPSA